MKELYEYMKGKRDMMLLANEDSVTIDMSHFFRLYQTVCFMIQIRNIVNYDEDMEALLEQMGK